MGEVEHGVSMSALGHIISVWLLGLVCMCGWSVALHVCMYVMMFG